MKKLTPIEKSIQNYGGIWTKEGWVVERNLYLWGLSLFALPKIKSVGGHFYCGGNPLTNLTGSPKSVGGNFYCHHNLLTSLTGSPKSVSEDFDCSHNQLTNLAGSPKFVGGNFYCYENPLKSLSGLPDKIGGNFWCDNNLSFPKEEIMLLIKAHPGNLEEAIKKIKWI